MTLLSIRQRSPRRLPAEERREAILAAAKPVFGLLGYDRATTREIAAAAAVSEALLYQHFPGKRQLFEAIVNQAAADLEQRLCVAADSDEPLSRAVTRVAGVVLPVKGVKLLLATMLAVILPTEVEVMVKGP